MAVKIRNINGTSDNTCKCGSWLEHWRRLSGKAVGQCREKACISEARVGAHVQKVGDANWYIIPLCELHNSSSLSSLEVIDATTFVSANVSKTCGGA